MLFLAPSVLLRLAKDPLVERHDTSSLRTIYVAAAPVSKSSQQEIATRLNVTDIRQGTDQCVGLLLPLLNTSATITGSYRLVGFSIA